MEEEVKIFVMYVGVAEINPDEIDDFIHAIAERITPSTFIGEIIFLPRQSVNHEIVCINPKYITEKKLIDENTKMIKILNEELLHQVNQLKNDKNL